MKPQRALNNLESGFTLIEVIVVVAVIGILAAVTIPRMGDMIDEYKLRSAAREMVSNLQKLKLKAIKENNSAKIIIDPAEDTYQAFVDSNNDNAAQAAEIYQTTNLRVDDLNISCSYTTPDNVFGFNSRGLPSDGAGNITITKDATRSKQIFINIVGRIRVN